MHKLKQLALGSLATAALLLGSFAGATGAQAASACHFQLGFATLAALIPQQSGQCTDNEARNPVNGDALQHSTNGLLVWRKLDNWTAYTNGFMTWINGPAGVQSRLNGQRFSWEANPDGLPSVGGSAPPVAPIAPAPTPAPSIGTRMQSSIGTTGDWKTFFGGVPFHAVVTDAFRTTIIPATDYSFGGQQSAALAAPGNGVFAVFILTVTNVGTVSSDFFDIDLAVRDRQGRTFTYGQTPDGAFSGVKDFFGLKGVADGLGPSNTDKFLVAYVVASDSTNVILVPAP